MKRNTYVHDFKITHLHSYAQKTKEKRKGRGREKGRWEGGKEGQLIELNYHSSNIALNYTTGCCFMMFSADYIFLSTPKEIFSQLIGHHSG